MGLDGAQIFTCTGDAQTLLCTDVTVGELASTETNGHFDLVPLFEESAGGANLDADVMFIGLGPQLHLFELNLDLVLASDGSALFTVVLQLPVILDSAYWRPIIRSDFDEVEPAGFGEANGVLYHELTELVALLVYDKDTRHADSGVDARLVLVGFRLNATAW